MVVKKDNTFHKNKYFRVKRRVKNSGNTIFQVYACDNIIELIFGVWTEYTKHNESLEEALLQIQTINSIRLKEEKIVHKETYKD